MNPQVKDKMYDIFLREPTKENFRLFIKNNCGEFNEVDYKKEWPDKGKLAKIILAMANSRGGIIIVGVEEQSEGDLVPTGLESFRDKADINNDIAKYISPNLDYEIFDFAYESSDYALMENKKFQMVVVHDTPERLPFISLSETTGFEKDCIYVRRGTKCEKATSSEIEKILDAKISVLFKETSDLTLEEHLHQLKRLYDELPQKIKVLVRAGTSIKGIYSAFENLAVGLSSFKNEYEEKDNPNYPEESYEAFILRMIKGKKLKIEKILDLK